MLSSRVFAAIDAKTGGFIDLFKTQVELPYTSLLEALNEGEISRQREALQKGFEAMDAYMRENASQAGPFFSGVTPGIAETTIAPCVFRMCATLPAIRHMDAVRLCKDRGAERVLAWMEGVLENPTECCDVLPAEVYIHHARRLYVTYETALVHVALAEAS